MEEDGRTPYSTRPERVSRTPYHRSTPHITQEPITDDALRYRQRVHPGAYPAAEQPGQVPQQAAPRPGRRHMGVATADPQYLPPTGPAHPRRQPQPGEEGERPQLHYERYLQTPSGHKSIFISRQERERRRVHILVALLIVVLVALAVWFLFLN